MIIFPPFSTWPGEAFFSMGATGSTSCGEMLREKAGGVLIGDWPHIAWLPPLESGWEVFTVVRDPFARMGCIYGKMLAHAEQYYPSVASEGVLGSVQDFARWVAGGARPAVHRSRGWNEAKRWTIFQTQSALIQTVTGMGATEGPTKSRLRPLLFEELPYCLVDISNVHHAWLVDFPQRHRTGCGQKWGSILREDPKTHDLIKLWARADFQLLRAMRKDLEGKA